MNRRSLLFGLLAAPAIMAAPSLMRVSTLPWNVDAEWIDGNDLTMRANALAVKLWSKRLIHDLANANHFSQYLVSGQDMLELRLTVNGA